MFPKIAASVYLIVCIALLLLAYAGVSLALVVDAAPPSWTLIAAVAGLAFGLLSRRAFVVRARADA